MVNDYPGMQQVSWSNSDVHGSQQAAEAPLHHWLAKVIRSIRRSGNKNRLFFYFPFSIFYLQDFLLFIIFYKKAEGAKRWGHPK